MNLIQEGKKEKAKAVLAKSEQEIPAYNVPHDFQSGSLDLAKGYALTAQPQKAQQLIDQLWKKASQYLTFYCALDGSRFSSSQHDCMIQLYVMQQIVDVQELVDQKKADQLDQQLQGYMQLFESKGGSFGQ